LCVDKTTRLLRLVEHGDVTVTLDARFGLPGTNTREGSFRVSRKSRDHWSSLYHTWMPFAMFFSGGQAVHYSPYFDRDGYNGGSHGCIGLRDFARARALFDHVPMGTKVYVYWS
jgi:lipoprotein-anchoring transpeptidase ErfK/SrfK